MDEDRAPVDPVAVVDRNLDDGKLGLLWALRGPGSDDVQGLQPVRPILAAPSAEWGSQATS